LGWNFVRGLGGDMVVGRGLEVNGAWTILSVGWFCWIGEGRVELGRYRGSSRLW
jgi:hypothetical protein